MEENRQSVAFCTNTVGGFRTLNEAGLAALAADLSLRLPLYLLKDIQRHFVRVEKRDCTVGELCLSSAYANALRRLPQHQYPENLTFTDAETARTWQDLYVQYQRVARDAMHPASLLGTLKISNATLLRAGRGVYHTGLMAGSAADVALSLGEKAPLLTLTCGDATAALTETAAPQKIGKESRLLLAIHGTDEKTLPEAITDFFKAAKGLSPLPVASIGEEGLLPHLLTLGKGATLYTERLQGFDEERAISSLESACRRTSLVSLPESQMPTLLANGAAVTPIGTLAQTGHTVWRHGSATLATLSPALLKILETRRTFTAEIGELGNDSLPVSLTETDRYVLAGCAVKGFDLPTLCQLVSEAVAHGGRKHTADLAAVLTLPQKPLPETAPVTLSVAMAYHRMTSELALPTATLTTVEGRVSAPTLAVFLVCDKGEIPDGAQTALLNEAARTADFAAMRRLLLRED